MSHRSRLQSKGVKSEPADRGSLAPSGRGLPLQLRQSSRTDLKLQRCHPLVFAPAICTKLRSIEYITVSSCAARLSSIPHSYVTASCQKAPHVSACARRRAGRFGEASDRDTVWNTTARDGFRFVAMRQFGTIPSVEFAAHSLSIITLLENGSTECVA